MRHHKPFRPRQRNEASAEYQSFRSHVRLLGKLYAPVTRRQRTLFRAYRDDVHAIGSELLKVDGLVNVNELNDLCNLARLSVAEYARAKQFGE